jgi:opacity protein-like surface antigen
MIRYVVATITLAVLISSFACAQDTTPKVQVFGGYSLLRADHGGLSGPLLGADLNQASNPFALPTYFFNGWNAEAQYNTSRWIGIAADFGGRSGTPITASRDRTLAGLPKETAYAFLAGPVLSYRTKSKLTPYVHGLFGFDRTRLGASTITGSVTSPVSVNATTFNDFAMALGGGVDYGFTRHFSVRLAQLDWYRTTINLSKFYTSAFGGTLLEGLSTRQVNVRFSAGAVVWF